MKKAFVTILTKPKQFIEAPPRTIQLLPTELYILPEGSKFDRPSFVLVLTAGDRTPTVVTQLSFQMLFDSMDVETKQFLKSEIEKCARDSQ